MQFKHFGRQGLSIMIALALLFSLSLPVRAEGETGNVAAWNGSQYASLGDALAAAINSGSPATVTMLQDTTIAGVGERIDINLEWILEPYLEPQDVKDLRRIAKSIYKKKLRKVS